MRRHNTAYPTTMDHFRQEGSGLLTFPKNLDAYIELISGLGHDNPLHELFQPWIQHDLIDEEILGPTLKQLQFRLLRRGANLKSPLDIILLNRQTTPDLKQTLPSQ